MRVSLRYLQMNRGTNSNNRVPHEPKAYQAFIRPYYRFKITGYNSTFGLLLETVVNSFQWPEYWTIDQNARTLTLSGGRDVDERSELFSETLQSMVKGTNVANLDKPKGELLPVFGPRSEHLLDMDRTAAVVFGIVSYGVQMLAYVRAEKCIKYWVPRRAKTKRSYPGMLDNCVGGALNTGETPLTCLMREACEEASLPEAYVRDNAKPFGVVSYHMATNGNGEEGHQPQVMYVYHIELTPDVVPTPSDGEVEKFELMTLEDVQAALRNSEFKTNCAATWISYLISLGVINAESEPNLQRITTHLHRRLDFPVK